MTVARIGRLSREVLLTSAAILGVLCLLMVAAGFAFGVRPLMFRSGSMAPTIDTGDLSISRTVDAAGLHRGDVVSVIAADGQRVTHRVVTSTAVDGHRRLTLKGDANKVVDQQVYDVTSAEKVMFTIPKAGYVVDWLSRAPGVYLVAVYVGLLLMLIGRRSPGTGGTDTEPRAVLADEEDPARPVEPVDAPRGRHGRAGVVAAGVLGLALVAVAGWTIPTWAAWTDPVPVNGTSFSAGTWAAAPAAPTIDSCVLSNGNSADTSITWSAATDPTKFEVRYLGNANAVQSFTGDLRGGALTAALNNTNGEFWLVAIGPGGTSADSNHYVYAGNGNKRTCQPK